MLGGAVLLLVYGIGVVLARALLYQAGEPRWSVAFAYGTMLQLVVSLGFCRFTENTVTATLLFGAVGLVALWFLWRRGPPFAQLHVEGRGPGPVALAFAALALLLAAWAALGGYWWDESFLHYKLAGVLGRGVVPPVHPLYPLEPIRYHYGYDFLAGQVRAFTGMSIVHALDVTTIYCFLLLLGNAAALGGALAGRRGAGLAMILIPFGTGLLRYLLFRDAGTMELHWDVIPKAWFDPLPPPVISNFFQHPQGFGMSIALAVLVLFDGSEVDSGHRFRRTFLGGLLLGTLSIANVAFFMMLGLMLGVAVLWRGLRERQIRRAAVELGFLAGALVIAFALGGVFSPGGKTEQMLLFGKSFFPDPLGPRIVRYLVLFGVPLLALPFAARQLFRRPSMLRVALFFGAVLGYLLPNFVVYARSWDIVKFLGLATFFASALLADLLARTRTSVTILVTALATVTSWAFLVRMSVMDGQLGVPPMHFGRHHPVEDAVADRLSPLVPPRDHVFTVIEGTARGGGFLTPGFRWQQYGSGFMMDRAALDRLSRHHARARRDLSPEDLAALEVKWAVLRPEDVARLSPRGKKALQDPKRFEHLFDVELRGQKRHVYRILPAARTP